MILGNFFLKFEKKLKKITVNAGRIWKFENV